MSKKRRRPLTKKYRFIVPGKPFGYLAITGKQKWTKEYQRFADYAKKVRMYAERAGVPIPLYADEENQIIVKTIAYYPNRVHCDAPNTNKGVCDALFYDEEAVALAKLMGKKKATGKGDDKYAGCIAPPPRYNKDNPRCVVIIKPYVNKDDLRDSKRKGKGRADQNRDDVGSKKRKKKTGAADRKPRKAVRDRQVPWREKAGG